MKNRINFNDYKKIRKPEIAYILGLIWADGHISFANNKAKTPIIKHNSTKIDNIDFIPIFNKTGKWNTFNFFNKKAIGKKEMSCNWISNRILGEYLIKLNYRMNSISPDKILKKIPKNIKHYWLRGYFDGDGSISMKIKGHKSLTFSSNKDQDWSFIVFILDQLDIKYKHRILKDKLGQSSQIRITKQIDILKFAEYIYPNFIYDFGLKRKYNKLFELKQHIDSK